MEVVAATFWRTSESRQVHPSLGLGCLVGPLSFAPIKLTELLDCRLPKACPVTAC